MMVRRAVLTGVAILAAPFAFQSAALAQAPAEGEALIFAEIDPAAYAGSRAENTYLADLARQV